MSLGLQLRYLFKHAELTEVVWRLTKSELVTLMMM